MATTHIKRSTSASRLVNYAEKRAVKKDGFNLDIQYAKSELKKVITQDIPMILNKEINIISNKM